MSRQAATSTPGATDFASHRAQLEDAGPDWLRDLRDRALARFRDLGFPTVRLEAWKKTSVADIEATEFSTPADALGFDAARLARLPLQDTAAVRAVVVDGRLEPALGALDRLPDGVRVEGLAASFRRSPDGLAASLGRIAGFDDHAFCALNTALFRDGVLVTVDDGVVVPEPIHVVHVTSACERPVATHPRTLVVCGRHAQAAVVETFVSERSGDVHLTNTVTEAVVGENASLALHRVQLESRSAFHLGRVQVVLARDGRLHAVNVALGARLSRVESGALLGGDGALASLDGLYVADSDRHVDNQTSLDHAAPHGVSHELYKGILSGRSRAVFNGRIVVRQDAQKTDAKQSNPNLLLSDDATVHTRPQLEIYADDVRCTHGATIGHLDPEATFYLRSRGLGAEQARDLLIHAFAREILDRIDAPGLREALAREIDALLPDGTPGEGA